jgi:hypothetical protein
MKNIHQSNDPWYGGHQASMVSRHEKSSFTVCVALKQHNLHFISAQSFR